MALRHALEVERVARPAPSPPAQIRRQQAIDEGKTQRRVYVDKPDMRAKKLARKVGRHGRV